MKTMKKGLAAIVLFVLSAVLVILARTVNGFADWHYKFIYRPVSTVFAFVFQLVPFSVIELFLYIAIGYLVYRIIWAVIHIGKKNAHYNWKQGIQRLFLTIAILCFLFVMNCGINYHKKTFAATEGFTAEKYEKEQLKSVCIELTKKMNELVPALPMDKDGHTRVEGDLKGQARKAMQDVSEKYPSLKGYYPRPKGVITGILSIQRIGGIYSPFTVEANYNDDMPEYLKPFTMCHELSHLKGVMHEEEANFAGFLACINSDNKAFQYSGYLFAYSYCMNELIDYDKESYKEIKALRCERVNSDLKYREAFWEKYDGTISNLSDKANDVYLKANAQEDGTKSYNQVVGLLLSYYKHQK